MRPESKKLLWDAREAAVLVADFIRGRDFSGYQVDALLRSGVERQLEIVGEALAQLRRTDPDLSVMISYLPRVVGLRNILIHGYAVVESRLVWGVAQGDLPALRERLDELLRDG